MRSLSFFPAVTTLVAVNLASCDAFSTRASIHILSSRSRNVIMKASGTAESLDNLRAAQKANGGVVGDVTYDDGEVFGIVLAGLTKMLEVM